MSEHLRESFGKPTSVEMNVIRARRVYLTGVDAKLPDNELTALIVKTHDEAEIKDIKKG